MDGGDFAVGQSTCEVAVLADSVLELKANLSVRGVGGSSGKEPQSHEIHTSACAPVILRMTAVVDTEMLQQFECMAQLNTEGWCYTSCSQKHL